MDHDDIQNSGPEPKIGVGTARGGAPGQIKFKVFLNGVFLGWWTDVGSPEYWIVCTPDEAMADTFTQVPAGGEDIFFQKSSDNYISYRPRGASALGMKIRGWVYAAKFRKSGKNLLCVDNGQLVGTNDGYFYVNGQNVVELEWVS